MPFCEAHPPESLTQNSGRSLSKRTSSSPNKTSYLAKNTSLLANKTSFLPIQANLLAKHAGVLGPQTDVPPDETSLLARHPGALAKEACRLQEADVHAEHGEELALDALVLVADVVGGAVLEEVAP